MEKDASTSSKPCTVEVVFTDYRGRRTAIVRALTTDVERFYSLCDPDKENLCLYGYPSEAWEVSSPAEEVPAKLPEPAVGINFSRNDMQRKDWVSLVAVHSDAWLLAVASYHGARFNTTERKRLLRMINELPTVVEVVAEWEQANDKTKTDKGGSISKTSGKRSGNRKSKNLKSK